MLRPDIALNFRYQRIEWPTCFSCCLFCLDLSFTGFTWT